MTEENESSYWFGMWPMESRIAFVLFFGAIGSVIALIANAIYTSLPWSIDWGLILSHIAPYIPMMAIILAVIIYAKGQT